MIDLFHQQWKKKLVRLDITHLFVDEAQDLSLAQWNMAHDIEEVAKTVYIAGDDDQSIFTWAGANVEHFKNLKGKRIFLDQSYRCSKAVHDLAHQIISPIKRVEKDWKPRHVPGEIKRVNSITEVDMSHGTWLVLARNQFLLDKATNYCVSEGWLFDAPGRDTNEEVRAIRTWENLRDGSRVSAEDARIVYSCMSSKHVKYGFKQSLDDLLDGTMLSIKDLEEDHGLTVTGPWLEALDKISGISKEYVLRAEQLGEDIRKGMRIRISTIHASKGAEADHVVLFQDVAALTRNSYDEDPDDEHRVWYVGVTRAKETVTFIDNESKNTFYGKIYNV